MKVLRNDLFCFGMKSNPRCLYNTILLKVYIVLRDTAVWLCESSFLQSPLSWYFTWTVLWRLYKRSILDQKPLASGKGLFLKYISISVFDLPNLHVRLFEGWHSPILFTCWTGHGGLLKVRECLFLCIGTASMLESRTRLGLILPVWRFILQHLLYIRSRSAEHSMWIE